MSASTADDPADPASPARPPSSTPQRQAVVDAIRRAIILRTLRPGEKLREVKLAASLGVSRPTLREALNLLVQDGLLVQEPYRGFSVTTLSDTAIRDIAQTRVPLDLIAVHAILDDTTGRRMDLLLEAWKAFEDLAFDPDPVVQHEAHVAFHRGLWVASENTMLLRLWPVTEALTTIVLAEDQAAHDDPSRAHSLHARLVAAIRSRDLAVIEDQLRRHTIDSAEALVHLHDLESQSHTLSDNR